MKLDSKGFFLFDTQSKPVRHLAEGLPLSYETEKEIDLSDKGGMFQFMNSAKKEEQVREMPVTILVPNPRSMYCQQLSFASIAKTIMTLCFLGQRLRKNSFKEEVDLLQSHIRNLRYLKEFDVKVQID
jgi:hypothetical protein